MRKRYGASLLLAILLLLSQVVTVAAEQNHSPNIAQPESSAYGKNYSQWAEEWYQWVFSLWGTVDVFGPGDCVKDNQTQKVFFLTGTSGSAPVTRACTVPTGTPLFFPVLNQLYIEDPAVYDPTMNPPYVPATWVKLLKKALAPDNVALDVRIDGVRINNLRDYMVITRSKDPLSVNIPGFGIWEGVQGGFYLLLHPLSKGQHTIRIVAEQFTDVPIPVPAGIGAASFSAIKVELTLNLKVVPGKNDR
jgi:hypothetical protein